MAVHTPPVVLEVKTIGQRLPTPKELALMKIAYGKLTENNRAVLESLSPVDFDVWFKTIVAMMRELAVPTQEMIRAGTDALPTDLCNGPHERNCWQAMLGVISPPVAGVD